MEQSSDQDHPIQLQQSDELHPSPDVAPPDNDNALTPAEVVDNVGASVGDFGIGTQVWGTIGAMHHVVRDGQTTVCDKQLDPAGTQRLATPPQGMLCGVCLGRLVGA